MNPKTQAFAFLLALLCLESDRLVAGGVLQADLDRLKSASIQERDKAAGRIAAERKALIAALRSMACEEDPTPLDLREFSAKCLAIRLLGDFRAEEAMEELFSNLKYEIEPHAVGYHWKDIWNRYPAARSLVKIGKPAAHGAQECLLKSDDKLTREISVWIIVCVDGPETANFELTRMLDSGIPEPMKSRISAAIALVREKYLKSKE